MVWRFNFFELLVMVAISIFGIQSPVVLATIVGVLIEISIMHIPVKVANNTKKWFKIIKVTAHSGIAGLYVLWVQQHF